MYFQESRADGKDHDATTGWLDARIPAAYNPVALLTRLDFVNQDRTE
jgi:hypothetical protein